MEIKVENKDWKRCFCTDRK